MSNSKHELERAIFNRHIQDKINEVWKLKNKIWTLEHKIKSLRKSVEYWQNKAKKNQKELDFYHWLEKKIDWSKADEIQRNREVAFKELIRTLYKNNK